MGERRVLAIDVGGTRIKAAVVGEGTSVGPLAFADTPTGANDALEAVARLGRELAGSEALTGVGLCVPGLVADDGRIVALPGKLDGIVGRDLPAEIEAMFGRRAVVVNDAVAYGAGEAAAGAGAGAHRVVVMTIGTGVGVAVLEQGRPISSGPLGGGIQGGQILLPDGHARHLDTSDHHDTLEACVRARRIVDYAVDAGGAFDTVEDVYDAYARGDAAALAGIERFRAHLVRGVRALANAHGADVVVIGGGPVTGDGPLLDGVEEAVRRELWPTHQLDVRRASLGDAAALVGLAELQPR
jgi:glucokinase